MSDPVTNIEIEDVLSSIRRLVSEETRKTTAETKEKLDLPSPVEPKVASKAVDRLVLTPALRVSETLDDSNSLEKPLDLQGATQSKPGFDPQRSPMTFGRRKPPQPEMDETGEVSGLEGHDDFVGLGGGSNVADVDAASNLEAERVAAPEPAAEEIAPPKSERPISKAYTPPSQDLENSGSEQEPWRDPQATLYAAAASVTDVVVEPPEYVDDPAPEASEFEASATDQSPVQDVVEPVEMADERIEPEESFDASNWETGAESDPIEAEMGDAVPSDDQPLASEGELEELSAPVDAVDDSAPVDVANDSAAEDAPEAALSTDVADSIAEPEESALSEADQAIDGLTAKIAELEAKIGRSEEIYDPDEPGTSAYAGIPVKPVAWSDEEATAETGDEPQVEESAQSIALEVAQEISESVVADPEPQAPQGDAPAEDMVETGEVDAASVELTPPAEDRAPADELPEQDGESDVAESDDPSSTSDVETATVEDPVQSLEPPSQDMDAAAPAMEAEPTAEADEARIEAEAANADIFATDEMVLDEETLRELVTDIVRQELQGALGERITRNVRKLVRREIHRALAASELD